MKFEQWKKLCWVSSTLPQAHIGESEIFLVNRSRFSETWLNDSIASEDLLLQSYNKPERKDRPGDSHGGVVLYVKEGLHYKRRNDQN